MSSIEDFRQVILSKNPNLEQLAGMIRGADHVLSEALSNLTRKNETIRYNSYRALRIISRNDPGWLYPHWDFFISQLESPNTYHILAGIQFIADLTAADEQSRFEKIFGQYYDLLNHRSMVIVSHVSLASGRIMLNKPGLIKKIEDHLLGIDKYIQNQKHQHLIKAAVMEAFMEAREVLTKPDQVRQFALPLVDAADSPKCRKLARAYLEQS